MFDLAADPNECRNLAADPACTALTATWRRRLIAHLADRPEGFTDGARLLGGTAHEAVPPTGVHG